MTAATRNRTDIHRPSLMDPAEYQYLGCFYQGRSDEMHDAYGRDHADLNRAIRAHGNPAKFHGNHEARGTCDHCGAAFAHGVVFLHTPTREQVTVGHICAANTVGLPSAAAVARRRNEQAAQREREIAEAVEACPEDVRMALQANHDSDRPNQFLSDLYGKLYRRGWALSERQIEAVRRSVTRQAEFDARRAAEAALLADAPALREGRYKITGEVLSTKWQDSMYGMTLKMLVRIDDGNKVYGTVPSSMSEDIRGERIEFTAQVERSRDDDHFGFFKRPTGAAIL